MTDSPKFESMISQIEDALITATELKSTLVVDLLRMAVLAAFQDLQAPQPIADGSRNN